MRTSGEPPTTTVHGVAQSIVVLPYQLGYRPQASLVLLCLRQVATAVGADPARRRGMVALTARVDLPPPCDYRPVLEAIEPALRRPDTEMVLLIAFEDGHAVPHDATAALRAVAALAQRCDTEVTEMVRVRQGRWRSVAIDTGGDADWAWQDLPAEADVPLVADYVLAGRSPVADRGELEHLLTPTNPELAAGVRTRLEEVSGIRRALVPRVGAGLHTLAQIVRAAGPQLPDLDGADLADCAVALHDLRLRDTVLAALAPGLMAAGDVPAGLARWVHDAFPRDEEVDDHLCYRLLRAGGYIPAGWAAPVLTVAGYVGWQRGEGAVATIATLAALDADPEYSLARLVDLALRSAVRPPLRR